MKPFAEIYDRAAERHGGEAGIQKKIAEFSYMNNPVAVADTPDARFLSQMTKCVFQAGFNWKVIENKWEGFEEAFQGFDIDACAFLSDDGIDELCKDTRIVRNRPKVMTVPGNARFIQKVRSDKGSFGKFLTDWPSDDQLGLMNYMQAEGSRLGGKTGQYFLRFSGWDAFVLSKDGTAAMIDAGVVDKYPISGKGAFRKAQDALNAWHAESGRPYSEISRILALSTDLEG
ncbi:MAG: DNA-3-methyladenine glycosylase I [Sphingomonadales bacterium]